MAKKNTLKNVIVGISLFILVLGGASAIKSCSEDKMPNIEDVLGNTSEDTSKDDNTSSDIIIEDTSSSEDSGSTDNGSSSEDNTTSEDENTSTDDVEFVSQYHFTIVGSMNEWDVANNDYLFTTTDDITFVINMNLSSGDEWKIVNENAWEWTYNTNNVLDDGSRNFIDTSSTDNIKMTTSGNYDITLNIENHSINLSYVSALE